MNIDGLDIYFIYVESFYDIVRFIIIIYGWFGFVFEFYKVIEFLVDFIVYGGNV